MQNYFWEMAPERALTLLGGMRGRFSRGRIDWMLRDHRRQAVVLSNEISLRQDVDRLLEFVSILEVASVAGVVPTLPSGGIIDALYSVLCLPAVRKYYTQYYPLVLPDQFRRRLTQKYHDVPDIGSDRDRENAALLFESFLAVTESVRADPDINLLFLFLDDVAGTDQRGSDLVVLVSDLPVVLNAVMDPQTVDPHQGAVRGFLRYSAFGSQLVSVLDQAVEYPHLRAAMWNFYAYWIIEFKSKILDAITSFARGARRLATKLALEDDERAEVIKSTSDHEAVWRRLCDPSEWEAPPPDGISSRGKPKRPLAPMVGKEAGEIVIAGVTA